MLENDLYDLEGLLLLGRCLVDLNRLQDAVDGLARVLKFDTGNVEAHFFCGVALARLRRYEEAVDMWERVIRLDPGGRFAKRAREHARTAVDLKRIFSTDAA